MLLGNGFARLGVRTKQFGGTAVSGANPSVLEGRWSASSKRNLFAGEGGLASVASVPNGARHPMVWVMPRKAGGLTTGGSMGGSGGVSTGTMQLGYNIDADISGSGGITNAPLGLIVSIAAALIGSGGISSATTQALASMVATLTGSGNVTATAKGLADLGAVLTGSGSVNANNTALMDIAAQIRGYGDLTPEGIRDSVWSAVLANYPVDGTAGKALSTASSGGVDLNALANAVWTHVIESGLNAEEFMRVMASALAGTSQKTGSTIVFKGMDGTTDRITGSFDVDGNRTGSIVDGT